MRINKPHGRPRTREDTPENNLSRKLNLDRYYTRDVFASWAGAAMGNMRARAEKKGLKCSVDITDLIELAQATPVCPILGVPLEYFRGRGDGPRVFAASIDRVNNKKGYHKNNIRIISLRANRLKANLSIDELIALAIYCLSEYRKDLR